MASGPSSRSEAAPEPCDGTDRTIMTMRTRAIGPVILTMVLACLPAAVDARRAASIAPSLPLEPMSYADAERAGAVGTGCTWRGGPDRKARLSMADDRAAVRWNGGVVVLKPTADSHAMFFTYDRWTGAGISIVIRDTGKVLLRGHELTVTIARLDLTQHGRTISFMGQLNCGS